MDYQNVFQRYELKYILNKRQVLDIKDWLSSRMRIDAYGPTVIRNIYLDTDNYRLIRTSLDRPVYKEKIRLRSYRYATYEDTVFVELKKKYEGVVFKRRIESPNSLAMDWLSAGGEAPEESQIAREITYFRDFYEELKPKAFISYEREAYEMIDGSDLRITFDTKIFGRNRDISFSSAIYGQPILGEELTLMEIKIPGVMPLWLSHYLSKHFIMKCTFSKYGEYYKNYLINEETQKETTGGLLYA